MQIFLLIFTMAFADTTPTRPCLSASGEADVMVAVGPWCVDKYEASVWAAADGGGATFFTDSTVTSDTNPHYPQGGGNAPPECNRDGSGCSQFAVSKANAIPARGLTWYQAARFCVNAGKVLIPDSVWQIAAMGTHDPGEKSGTGGLEGGANSDGANARCNTNSSGKNWKTWSQPHAGVRRTGHAGRTHAGPDACISDFGVEDMIGNLWEWTESNTVPTGVDTSTFTQGKFSGNGGTFGGSAGVWNINGSAFSCAGAGNTEGACGWKNNVPAAPLRGGSWGNATNSGVTAVNLFTSASHSGWSLGFRCARLRALTP